MTKPARITYADVLRTMKAIKAAGIQNARVVMRLQEGVMEVIIGEGASAATHDLNEWSDDDV